MTSEHRAGVSALAAVDPRATQAALAINRPLRYGAGRGAGPVNGSRS